MTKNLTTVFRSQVIRTCQFLKVHEIYVYFFFELVLDICFPRTTVYNRKTAVHYVLCGYKSRYHKFYWSRVQFQLIAG